MEFTARISIPEEMIGHSFSIEFGAIKPNNSKVYPTALPDFNFLTGTKAERKRIGENYSVAISHKSKNPIRVVLKEDESDCEIDIQEIKSPKFQFPQRKSSESCDETDSEVKKFLRFVPYNKFLNQVKKE